MLARLPESHRNFAIQLKDYMWLYSDALEGWYGRRRKHHEQGLGTPGQRHLVKTFMHKCHVFFKGDCDLWMMNLVLELHGQPYQVRLTSGGHLTYNSVFFAPDTDDGILCAGED